MNKEIKRMDELIASLNENTKLYDENKATMLDKAWDKLYFELERLEKTTGIVRPESPTHKIVYKAVSNLEKIEHNHPMLSLNKTKSFEELCSFIGDKKYAIMSKMDGLTCSLKYSNGVLVSAETRGDGRIGESILHNAEVVPSIPKEISYKEDLVIDGEIICTYTDFKDFEKEYKNPRNFASGSIRLLNPRECEKRKLKFIAWDVVSDFKDYTTLTDKLINIQELGFTIVPIRNSASTDNREEELYTLGEWIINLSNALSYPIDGLVVKYDDCEYYNSLGYTEHHFRGGLAFKFVDEEYETTLQDIIYDVSRMGILTPVAIFDPIEIDGTIISKASIHNISIMETLSNGKQCIGDTLSIVKANQIIPQITKWTHTNESTKEILIPKTCPICGGATEIKVTPGAKFLECTNPQCTGKIINILDFYCGKKGLDIKGLSKATLTKLIDWGWIESIEDIYKLSSHREDWTQKSGFGEKSVDNILNAIEQSKHCSLSSFIISMGIPGIGKRAAADLMTRFKTYDSFISAVKDPNYSFEEIDGIGSETNRKLKNFDYTIFTKIKNDYLVFKESTEESKSQTQVFNGEIFVITGKLINKDLWKNRDELKLIIENAGGKVSNTVTSKTAYLINNDTTSMTAKNKTAKELNIPIISENDFISILQGENNK